MQISKKDLLLETGISYGQLYRWKRANLIPEEWFIKQSSYTGQETFFPREKILNRIEFIMKMKDQYSLEEIAEMLSYDSSKAKLTSDVLKEIEEIDSRIIDTLEKDEYSYIEVLYMIILSKLLVEENIELDSIEELIKNTNDNIKLFKNTNYSFAVYIWEENYLGLIYEDTNSVLMDKRLEFKAMYNFEDIEAKVQQKYGKKFNEYLGEK